MRTAAIRAAFPPLAGCLFAACAFVPEPSLPDTVPDPPAAVADALPGAFATREPSERSP